MDNLEGMLLVPPERGQILGRAVWKVSLLYRAASFLPRTHNRSKSCDMLSLVDVTPEVALVNHSLHPTVATTVLGAADLSPNYP
jgi:hypothetical protein